MYQKYQIPLPILKPQLFFGMWNNFSKKNHKKFCLVFTLCGHQSRTTFTEDHTLRGIAITAIAQDENQCLVFIYYFIGKQQSHTFLRDNIYGTQDFFGQDWNILVRMELGRCADTVTKIVHLGFSTIYLLGTSKCQIDVFWDLMTRANQR